MPFFVAHGKLGHASNHTHARRPKVGESTPPFATKGIKDTIEAALDEVIAYEARRQAVEQLRNLEGLDLDNPKVMARAWRGDKSPTRARSHA
jgi:hypothetical protein